MREILFRGKRADNGEWVEGQLLYFQATVGTSVLALIVEGCEWDNFNEWFNLGKRAKVIPETIGQYTGLTANGTKIFEGDILHFKTYQGGGFACPIGTDVYYRVLFGQCNPDMNTLTEYVGFWALSKNYDEDDLYEYGSSIDYLINSHGACVIGNIHDNPELLKGGKGC